MSGKKKYTGVSHKTEAEEAAGEKAGNRFNLEDTAFIKANQHVHDGFVNGHGSSLDGVTRNRMIEIIQKIEPDYTVNTWCPDCLVDMVKHLYRLYNENK